MKADLRRRARMARAAFAASLSPAVRRAMEQALAEQVAPVLAGHRILGSYAAVGGEIDPSAIEARWAGPLAFPHLGADGMEFRLASRAALRASTHGIPAPAADAPAVLPDCLLVPLLLFDARGNRIGQGGGHYDRMLAKLRSGGRVLAVGIAWDMQEEPTLPAEAWDEPLDRIATPTRLFMPGR